MKNPSHGFTLIELLIVLALCGALAGVAAPPLRAFAASIQLTAATNDLFGSLMLARSEAVRRNARVVLCKSRDGVLCTTEGGWDGGWIVFHDVNNDGKRQGAEPLLERGHPFSWDIHSTGNQNVAHYVSYGPSGGTLMVSGAFQSGTITFCRTSSGPTVAREIILSSAGRPRVTRKTLPSCT